MFNFVTIPSRQRIAEAATRNHGYMYPNTLPWGISLEGFLSKRQCETIVETYKDEPVYNSHGCNAHTRECPRPLHGALAPAIQTTRVINQMNWQFDLDHAAVGAWMQTYGVGNDYDLHCDAAPGQMRKLTAVVFLTDPAEYAGGSLKLRIEPRNYLISKKQGTIVIFPSWVTHRVDPVTEGVRQTINLGFWGPNFR